MWNYSLFTKKTIFSETSLKKCDNFQDITTINFNNKSYASF